MRHQLLQGDCRAVLAGLPAASVQTCVTSPPYFGLRDYSHAGQIGLEATVDAYVAELVAVFREVKRVLRDDGTLWCNLGDSYAASTKGAGGQGKQHTNRGSVFTDRRSSIPAGLKPKDLMLIPARVALALQADGWWLRSEIVWAKKAPMPESVRDRPTCAHEKVWLLSKRAVYFYDADAIREPASTNSHGGKPIEGGPKQAALGQQRGGRMGIPAAEAGRNARNVWVLGPEPSGFAHYAMMPTKLAERCIKAGSRPGDKVIDPFAGGGTTAVVAQRLGRSSIGIDLNAAYLDIARERLAREAMPLLAEPVAEAAAA